MQPPARLPSGLQPAEGADAEEEREKGCQEAEDDTAGHAEGDQPRRDPWHPRRAVIAREEGLSRALRGFDDGLIRPGNPFRTDCLTELKAFPTVGPR